MNDAKAASECKKIEGQIKAARKRIRRLTSMNPGPARQQERFLISADLTQIAGALYGIIENVMSEPQ